MRVIVTGGRDYKDRAKVWAELDALQVTTLVVGDCPTGADRIARDWYLETPTCRRCLTFDANWKVYGKRAGPIRNQAMVDAGADLALVFPGGKGTADCRQRLIAAGIPVKDIVPVSP